MVNVTVTHLITKRNYIAVFISESTSHEIIIKIMLNISRMFDENKEDVDSILDVILLFYRDLLMAGNLEMKSC